MPTLNRRTLVFALNSFAAAMLALYIALALDLQRPFWAMMTVYITSHPLAGAVRSKAVYRLVGTVVGAAAAVVLVPNLVNEPIVLSIAMALWVAGCLTVSLLDRTPRSYALMLAGYTAALIGFPAVDQPQAIFDIALSRVEEIGLGILCAAAVHSLVFPVSAGDALRGQLAKWLASADRWLLDVASQPAEGSNFAARDQRQLAAAVGELRLLATHLPYDISRLRDTQAAVQALNAHMLGLIPLLSALTDRRQALEAAGGLDATTRSYLGDVADWLRAGAPHAEGAELAEALREAATTPTGEAWPELLADNLLAQLADAVAALAECHALLAHLGDPDAPLAPTVAAALTDAHEHPLHRDLGLALRSGATSVVATLAACAIWIGAGWPDGAGAAAFAALFTALFATQDDPAPAMLSFGVASLMTLALGAAYDFGLLRFADSFWAMAALVAPPLVLFGLYMAELKTAFKGLALALTFAAALGLQRTLPTDFGAFLNGNLGLYAGLLIAVQATRMLRSLTAQASAQRLLRLTWTQIAGMAASVRRSEAPRDLIAGQIATAAPLVDRLALLAPRLAQQPTEDRTADDALRDVRVAMNLVALRAARAGLPAPAHSLLERLLAELADTYGRIARGGAWALPAGLLLKLDALLCLAMPQAGATDRRAARALVGIRRNLFPTAPPPALLEQQP